MAIAQMNWGRMQHPIKHPSMFEFATSLEHVYHLAEIHRGFVWRIPDNDAERQIHELGFGDTISATVSVWTTVEALRDYAFGSLHGQFLGRKETWFEQVRGPQLVIWDVEDNIRPTFKDAFEKLEVLKKNGPTEAAYGWPNRGPSSNM